MRKPVPGSGLWCGSVRRGEPRRGKKAVQPAQTGEAWCVPAPCLKEGAEAPILTKGTGAENPPLGGKKAEKPAGRIKGRTQALSYSETSKGLRHSEKNQIEREIAGLSKHESGDEQ